MHCSSGLCVQFGSTLGHVTFISWHVSLSYGIDQLHFCLISDVCYVTRSKGCSFVLLQVGEHAGCGPGILRHTGFSYDPETLMAAGVGVTNFSWQDMGVPDLERMMDIVQVGSERTGLG